MRFHLSGGQKRELSLLVLVVLLGFALRLAGSVLFPLWSGPEEGAHYFFIQYIGDNHALPMIPLTEETLASIANETIHQPPLYHLLAAVPYVMMKGQSTEFIIHALRLLSVLLGTICIPLTYLIAKKLQFGKNTAIASAMFIALLPTHIVTSATVNNSVMSWVLALGVAYYSIKAIEEKKAKDVALAGLLMAATFMTMFVSISVAGVYAIAWIVFLFKGKEKLWKRIAACAVPLVGTVIFIRNLALTGNLLPSYLRPMMEINLGWLVYFATHLFAGIWLQEYGTAAIPEYRVAFFAFYAIVSLTALAGFVSLMAGKEWNNERKKMIGAVMVLPIALNLAGVAYLNFFGTWSEARWLFGTISLTAILFIAGQVEFAKMAKQESRAGYLVLFILLSMLALDIVLLANYNKVLPPVIWNVPA